MEPDLLFVSDAQLEILTEMNVQGVPVLLIEVLSNPRIVRVRKRDIYARFGVPEYWIVDPDADRVEVYRHDGNGYGKPEIFEPGETLATPLLDGSRSTWLICSGGNAGGQKMLAGNIASSSE